VCKELVPVIENSLQLLFRIVADSIAKLLGILFLLKVGTLPECTQFRSLNGIRIKSMRLFGTTLVIEN